MRLLLCIVILDFGCTPADARNLQARPAWVAVPETSQATTPRSSADAQRSRLEGGVRVPTTIIPQPTDVPAAPPSIPSQEQVSGLALRSEGRMAYVNCDRCWMWPQTHVNGLPMAFLEQKDGVTVVRAERLSEKLDQGTLEIRDVWVDPNALGARLIRSLEVALTRVIPRGSSTGVYAYRTDEDVNLIVATRDIWQFSKEDEPSSRLWAETNCDHMRFVLPADAGGWTFLMNMRKRDQPTTLVRIEAARKGDEVAVREE